MYPYQSRDARPKEAHIFYQFADVIYRSLVTGSLAFRRPLGEQLRWDTQVNEPEVLWLGGTQVATGSASDHDAVKPGTQRFLGKNLDELSAESEHLQLAAASHPSDQYYPRSHESEKYPASTNPLAAANSSSAASPRSWGRTKG